MSENTLTFEELVQLTDVRCASDSCCAEHQGWTSDCLARTTYSHWVIIGLSLFAIVWGIIQAMAVSSTTFFANTLLGFQNQSRLQGHGRR